MAGQADRYQIYIVSGLFPKGALGEQRSDLESGDLSQFISLKAGTDSLSDADLKDAGRKAFFLMMPLFFRRGLCLIESSISNNYSLLK